jgi:hypothetical protein
MNATPRTIGLAFALSLAAIGAACGPPPPAESPGDVPAAPSAGAATAAPPAETKPAASTAPSTNAAPAPAPAAAGGGTGNVPLGPSKYIADVKKLGIDFKKATELEKVSLPEKKKLMPFFQRSLGFDTCAGCHAEGDYKQVTRNMQITRGMWRAFTAALRDDKDNPVFCDSCHQGKAKLLDRTDKKAVSKFMESDYQNKLTRADKKDHACATCHGEEMEMQIIDKLWKVSAR